MGRVFSGKRNQDPGTRIKDKGKNSIFVAAWFFGGG
jgi:hypothetical protein